MSNPPRQPPAAVSVSQLELRYGSNTILRGIDFSLGKGETLALLGPSGCGKTTLLRLVAGLLAPSSGTVRIGSNVVADAGIFVPPERRDLGMVFQDYALWPHMTVGGNVSFPLEMRGINRADRERRTEDALERVGLGGLAQRKPSELSGGQQQRVAIARAIIAEPALILFDEPLSNLDRELRETMVDEIGSLISTLGLTAIYVTHDHGEALSLADRVAIMRAGRIEQIAAPDRLVSEPVSIEVADFLRLGSIVSVQRKNGDWFLIHGDAPLASGSHGEATSTHALLPSGAIEIVEPAVAPVLGEVLRSQFRNEGHVTTVRIGPQESCAEVQLVSRTRLRPGERVGLRIDPQHIRWFSVQGNR